MRPEPELSGFRPHAYAGQVPRQARRGSLGTRKGTRLTGYPTVQLSDAEWMALLDGSRTRGGLIACCENIAAFRDVIYRLARSGGELTPMLRDRLIEGLGWIIAEHDVAVPALVRLVQQLDLTRPPAHRPRKTAEHL